MGCGRLAAKRALRRHVLLDGRVVPDDDARRPGRGAYLHPGEPDCLARALRRDAFRRAFRHRGPVAIAAAGDALIDPSNRLH